jgi:hypothetical protein
MPIPAHIIKARNRSITPDQVLAGQKLLQKFSKKKKKTHVLAAEVGFQPVDDDALYPDDRSSVTFTSHSSLSVTPHPLLDEETADDIRGLPQSMSEILASQNTRISNDITSPSIHPASQNATFSQSQSSFKLDKYIIDSESSLTQRPTEAMRNSSG